MRVVVGNLAFKLILKGLFGKLACGLPSVKFLVTCGRNVDEKLSTVSSANC